jgi:hypothetical protein
VRVCRVHMIDRSRAAPVFNGGCGALRAGSCDSTQRVWRKDMIRIAGVVPTEAIDPADHQDVARPQHVEKAMTRGALGEGHSRERKADDYSASILGLVAVERAGTRRLT